MRKCLLLLVFGIQPVSGAAAGLGPEKPLTFVVMADPQFGMFSDNAETAWEEERFERAVELLNLINPAFVVVCGDLVNRPADDTQADVLLKMASRIKAPVYWVPGNHDIGNTPTRKNLDWYRRRFGKDRYCFSHSSYRFLVLNSPLLFDPTDLQAEAEDQWRWLSSELLKDKRAPFSAVFLHHPPFMKSPDEKDAYTVLPKQRRNRLLELLKQGGVRAVFTGHHHRNNVTSFGSIPIVTVGPVGKPLGPDPSGFMVVHLRGKRLYYHYLPLKAKTAVF